MRSAARLSYIRRYGRTIREGFPRQLARMDDLDSAELKPLLREYAHDIVLSTPLALWREMRRYYLRRPFLATQIIPARSDARPWGRPRQMEAAQGAAGHHPLHAWHCECYVGDVTPGGPPSPSRFAPRPRGSAHRLK